MQLSFWQIIQENALDWSKKKYVHLKTLEISNLM
jgi:hypothetical protein